MTARKELRIMSLY